MKLTKIILTKDKELKKEIKNVIDLKKTESNNSFTIFEGKRKLFKDEESIVFAEFNNFEKTIKYIKENYEVFKIIIIGTANNLGSIDLKEGDIIVPNTFIKKDENPIFVEYVVGENYDLKKFGLLLSGICLSGKDYKSDDFIADIQDKNSYDILKTLKEEKLLDLSVIIKEIVDKNTSNYFKNIVNILDLVL